MLIKFQREYNSAEECYVEGFLLFQAKWADPWNKVANTRSRLKRTTPNNSTSSLIRFTKVRCLPLSDGRITFSTLFEFCHCRQASLASQSQSASFGLRRNLLLSETRRSRLAGCPSCPHGHSTRLPDDLLGCACCPFQRASDDRVKRTLLFPRSHSPSVVRQLDPFIFSRLAGRFLEGREH